jgi:methionyl-tRNA formyltransferase
MKVLFMSGGAREKALEYLLEKKVPVKAVVTPHLTTRNDRFKGVIWTAVSHGIPVIPVTKQNLAQSLQGISYDTIISCGFPYILDEEILASARYAINVHPTLLPAYRGYRSGPYILINGERQSGVTVHFLTTGMDQGSIIAQKAFDISPFDTTKSLFRKCREIEPALLYSVVEGLIAGRCDAHPQKEEQASVYSHVRTPEDSHIDWNRPLKDLYNEIRACDPEDYPAYFFVNGQQVCIKLWRPEKPKDEGDMI